MANCKDGTFLSPLTVMVDELQEEQYSDVFIPSDIDFTSKICIYPGTEYTLNTKIRLKSSCLRRSTHVPRVPGRHVHLDQHAVLGRAQHQQSPCAPTHHLCTCNAGYTARMAQTRLATLRAGTFKPAPGPEDCTECPQGTFMDPGTLASLSEDACLFCPEGTTSAVGSGGALHHASVAVLPARSATCTTISRRTSARCARSARRPLQAEHRRE